MHCRLKFDIGWPALSWATAGLPVSPDELKHSLDYFEHLFARNTVVGFSVRTLFDAILCELALPPGTPILMSGINIQNMADIATAHALRIVAVDIDPETLAPKPGALVDAQTESGAKLCLFTQLYGALNEISDADELRSRGVTVIEDAAQSFASTRTRWCREADISLLSFGPIKRRTALGGALGLFRDSTLASRIQQRLETYPAISDRWFRRRAMKYFFLKAISAPIPYGLLLRAISVTGRDRDTVIGEMARSFAGDELLKVIRYRPPPRMKVLMAQQIKSTPAASTRAIPCEEFLRDFPGAAVGSKADRHFHWVVPVLVPNPDNLIDAMQASGFDATRGATTLRALSTSDTPAAHALIEKVVYLPHPADMAPVDRVKMRSILLQAINDGA